MPTTKLTSTRTKIDTPMNAASDDLPVIRNRSADVPVITGTWSRPSNTAKRMGSMPVEHVRQLHIESYQSLDLHNNHGRTALGWLAEICDDRPPWLLKHVPKCARAIFCATQQRRRSAQRVNSQEIRDKKPSHYCCRRKQHLAPASEFSIRRRARNRFGRRRS